MFLYTDLLVHSPTMIAAYGASGYDDGLTLLRDRHGTHALVPAVEATLSYLRGERTRRGVADALGVPATEGVAVSQAVETHERVVADYPFVPARNE